MKSVKIANCDLDASEISLGCMRISQMTNPDIVTLIHTALDAGINFFDHADIYGGGQSEAKFAEALGMTPQLRDRMILQSKAGIRKGMFDFSKEHILAAVDGSLKRLQTEHIELVLVHSDGNDLAILHDSGVYETLAELKREGKIGAFGLSGKTVEGGLLALEKGDCAMVTYNLNEQAEKPVLDYAAAHGKAILIKKALASGHVCLQPGSDPLRASFELVFAHPGVSSAIVGTINPQHLSHNVALLSQLLRSMPTAD